MADYGTAMRNAARGAVQTSLASTRVKGTGWAKDPVGSAMHSAQRNGFGLRGLNKQDGLGSAGTGGGIGHSIAGPGNPGAGGRPLGC